MPICPHCQQTISVGRRICPACSRSLETPCPFCGFQLPGLFTRCPRCRQRLDVDAAAPPPASSSEEHGPPQPPPGAAPADAAGAPAPSPPLAAAAPAEPPPPCAAPAATAAIEPPLPSMAPAATAAPSSSSPAPPAQVALPVPPAAAAQTVSPAPVRVVGDPLVGQVLDGRFAVIQRLGTGGMGTVYKAQQLSVDRPVALKVMLPGCSGSPEQVARFMAEARTASQLRHPNTVVIFDFGRTEDGRLYLAMELLEGHQLTDLLREAGPLPWSRALGILVQICGSLSEAHQKGFLHRDIKPDNIIVGEMNGIPDFAKVLDFGIAKSIGEVSTRLTASGIVLGTPSYMSPEQARGGELDARSDLYSLGIVLYEMLAGRPPFQSDTPLALLMMHCTEPPPDLEEIRPGLELPPALHELLGRLLAKDREERPASALQLQEIGEAILGRSARAPGRQPVEVVRGTTPGLGRPPTGPQRRPSRLSKVRSWADLQRADFSVAEDELEPPAAAPRPRGKEQMGSGRDEEQPVGRRREPSGERVAWSREQAKEAEVERSSWRRAGPRTRPQGEVEEEEVVVAAVEEEEKERASRRRAGPRSRPLEEIEEEQPLASPVAPSRTRGRPGPEPEEEEERPAGAGRRLRARAATDDQEPERAAPRPAAERGRAAAEGPPAPLDEQMLHRIHDLLRATFCCDLERALLARLHAPGWPEMLRATSPERLEDHLHGCGELLPRELSRLVLRHTGQAFALDEAALGKSLLRKLRTTSELWEELAYAQKDIRRAGTVTDEIGERYQRAAREAVTPARRGRSLPLPPASGLVGLLGWPLDPPFVRGRQGSTNPAALLGSFHECLRDAVQATERVWPELFDELVHALADAACSLPLSGGTVLRRTSERTLRQQERAVDLFNHGDWPKALSVLQGVLAQEPEDCSTIALALRIAAAANHAEQIPSLLALLEQQGAADADSLLARAEGLQALGNDGAALALLEQAVRQWPAHRALRELLLEACLGREQLERAEKLAAGLIEDFPEVPGYHRQLARVHGFRKRPEEAIRALQRAARLAPFDADSATAIKGDAAFDCLTEDRRFRELLRARLDLQQLAAGLFPHDDSAFYFAEDIPERKLANAEEKWLSLEKDENVLFIIDTSLLGRCTEGIAASDRRIFAKHGFSDPELIILDNIRLDQLKKAEGTIRIGQRILDLSRHKHLVLPMYQFLTAVARHNS